METLYHLAWRGYPALALAFGGLARVIYAVVCECATPRARFGTDARLLSLLQEFRLAVIGLTLVGIAAAWYWHIPALLAIAVLIGAGETFEATNDITMISQAVHASRHRADATLR